MKRLVFLSPLLPALLAGAVGCLGQRANSTPLPSIPAPAAAAVASPAVDPISGAQPWVPAVNATERRESARSSGPGNGAGTLASPRPSPRPTATVTLFSRAEPARTSVPLTPAPAARYGVILHTTNPVDQEWFLKTLGATWFIDGGFGTDVPAGANKVLFVGSIAGVVSGENGPTAQELARIASTLPGMTWLVANEPNRRDGYDADRIIHNLHDIYTAIKAADPTARIVSPPLLNWIFTCIGCPGFGRGTDWAETFRVGYYLAFGEEPPIDIWAVNAYPIDWDNIPTLDPDLVIDQIKGLRAWLDERPFQAGKPIWVMEIGLHWGYDEIDFDAAGCDGLPAPSGTYYEAGVTDYLRAVYDWLDANAESQKIERWFQYISYRDITTCNTDGYAGLTLFDRAGVGGNLTAAGRLFRDRAAGVE